MMTHGITYSVPAELQGTMLDRIVRRRLPEVEAACAKFPPDSLRLGLTRAPEVRSLKRALQTRPGIIAEIKKASPSAGLLKAGFDPLGIARIYEKAGAAAISVLTEANFFQGSLETLPSARWHTRVPLLRKDFIVDPYQVLESRHAGADAVLLIAALLEGPLLRELRCGIEELGMDALVEVHSDAELDRALEAGATLIGVNHRDLRTFEIDKEIGVRLAARLPGNVVAVAESGIRVPEDVRRLAAAGFRGFLIGEALMRAESPGSALAAFAAALSSV